MLLFVCGCVFVYVCVVAVLDDALCVLCMCLIVVCMCVCVFAYLRVVLCVDLRL